MVTIPEREEILQFLRASKRPCTLKHIAEVLNVRTSDERAALNKRLKAMLRDGELIKNRREGYGLVEKMDLVRGTVIGHQDNYGFLRPDEGGDDLFLSAKEMRSLLHGDRILARVAGYDRKGRAKAALVEILQRANTRIVGYFIREDNLSFVIPDNKRIHQDIFIPQDKCGPAQPGQIVVAAIIRDPDKHSQPIGEVIEVLSGDTAAELATEIAIRAYEIPYQWPDEVSAEVTPLKNEKNLDHSNRLDLRALPFVTIDGEDARDFDDAVYCESSSQGWRLFVAIADVSHYVKPGSALDHEARLRGTSVYFPLTVVPMLPEVLSNDLCSLKPGVERFCLVCELHVNKQGKVKKYYFHNAVICSAARMTYNEMASVVIDKKISSIEYYAEISSHLDDLYSLYKLMHKHRQKLGVLDFDATESGFIFDNAGRIDKIKPLIRNDAHRLIEEFMLAANIAAADFLLKNEIPILFRNHETPKQEKLADLRTFLAELGLVLGGGDEPTAGDYAELIDKVKSRDDAHLIETVLLRSMPLAFYGESNMGHFGLAFTAYTHFTSPIRRYPDLLVHRAIRHLITETDASSYLYTIDDMHTYGEHCSMTERRAEEATRDATQRLKCEYMHDKLGEVFPGTVSSVTGFGLFVELDEVYVEGLVHVTSLPSDYYHFDAISHTLQGERTGKNYRLANRVRVKVARVNVEEKKIDFELLEG